MRAIGDPFPSPYRRAPRGICVDNLRLVCTRVGQPKHRSHIDTIRKRNVHMLNDMSRKAGAN